MNRHRWHELLEKVELWAEIAAAVEHGYSLTFDDYLNDVDVRRSIDEQLREIEETGEATVPKSITDKLTTADERFRKATIASTGNIWGEENERDSGWDVDREWYYYRKPTHWTEGAEGSERPAE